MAKILLNTRASRITLADNILLLPAEVRKDERLGKVVKPSRTLISERGDPSPRERIERDRGCQKLLAARVIEWSDEKVDEPEQAASFRGAPPYPREDQLDKAKTTRASSAADVDGRATIDESGAPLEAVAHTTAPAPQRLGETAEPGRGVHLPVQGKADDAKSSPKIDKPDEPPKAKEGGHHSPKGSTKG